MNFAVKSIFLLESRNSGVVIKVFVRGEIFRTHPYKTPRANEAREP